MTKLNLHSGNLLRRFAVMVVLHKSCGGVIEMWRKNGVKF